MSWEMKRIGEVCDVIPGFAFNSKDLGETGIPVVKIGNITDDYRVVLIRFSAYLRILLPRSTRNSCWPIGTF